MGLIMVSMFSRSMRSRTLACAASVVGVLVLAACGSGGSGGSAQDGDGTTNAKLTVVTAFYPLQYVTERVAGDQAAVSNLTKPGVEPHDLELSPKDVASVSKASLVVYLEGFQPAVDDAVEHEADSSLEVSEAADLTRPAIPEEEEGGEHADGADHVEHELTGDPHFWLDPTRLGAVATIIADRLARLDADNAQTYRANTAKLTDQLDTLDGEFKQGLASCQNKALVTSHQAFGYLADRYGLTQLGITGLSPEHEPSPAELAEVARFVRTRNVKTIYSETLVSPAIANTVARETGAQTAVLDPIEGITDASAAHDYLGVMRANLKTLQKGQSCS